MRTRTALASCGLAFAVVVGTAGSAAAFGHDLDRGHDRGHDHSRGRDRDARDRDARDHGRITTGNGNGNGSVQAFGDTHTGGNLSPQIGLVQGSLNKPCVALPVKANTATLTGATPISAQDINALSSPQDQQCTENSSQTKGDEALSHILSDIDFLSGNGTGNR
jgi:hypothetical protein